MNTREAFPEVAIGNRAWFLEQARHLETQLGFSTSNFTVLPARYFEDIGIDNFADSEAIVAAVDQATDIGFREAHPDVIEHFAHRLLPHLDSLRAHVEPLGGSQIIVRPSPLDELGRPELSFAGAYKGYMPLASKDRDEHLLFGTAAMLAGRYTKYGNYYHSRHGIEGTRAVGAIFMEPFFDLGKDVPAFYGTAYIAGDHMRNEYHVAPSPNEAQREPKLTVERGGNVWHESADMSAESAFNFTDRMSYLLNGLQDHFQAPLDVEYIMDHRGDLYVVQIREISSKHLDNWRETPAIDEAGALHRSAVLDSVGLVQGRVTDLRAGVDRLDMAKLNDSILVINHEPNGRGVHSQQLLQLAHVHNLQGIKVVVDHGESRLRDHLQYALVEDPGIDFVVQTTDPSVTRRLRDGEDVTLSSNGIYTSVA